MTYRDYKALPEGEHVELIDGVFVAMASASYTHNRLVLWLCMQLQMHLMGKRCQPVQDTDLRFEASETTTNALRPDIMVVCEPDMIDPKGGITGTPSMIVEVLSPSTYTQDMGKKLLLYQRNGVKEYWMVHQDGECINQYVLTDGEYRLRSVVDGRIVSTSIAGFAFDIHEMYASVLPQNVDPNGVGDA